MDVALKFTDVSKVLADSIIRAIAPIMGMKYVDKTLRYTLKN
jgi:hypothetical protein